MLHLHFFLNVLFIAACWSLGLLTLLGFGLAAERLGWKDRRDVSLSRAVWFGLLIILALLQLAHFVSPIDARLTLPLLLAGICFLWTSRRDLFAWFRARRPTRTQTIILGLLALWLILISIRPQRDGDSMLYHEQAVRWAQQYPVVTGIGNLHGRLAFNVESDLLFAALASGPWTPYPNALSNGFYLLLFLAAAAHTLPRRNDTLRPLRWFWIFFLPQLAIWSFVAPGSVPNDMAPFTFLTIATTFVLEALLVPAVVTPSPRDLLLTLAGWLAIGAILLKLSALAYALGLLVVCIILARKLRPAVGPLFLRWIAGATILLIPWILRNILLSGCWVYPIAATRLPLSWAVPIAQVRWEAWSIHVAAMWDGWPPSGASYVGFLRHLAHVQINEYYSSLLPAALGLLLLVASLFSRTRILHRLLPFALPFALATAFWFTNAPTLRFFGPVVWLFTALAAAGFSIARPAAHTSQGLLLTIPLALVAGLGPSWGLLHSDWSRKGPPQLLWDSISANPGPGGTLPPPFAYPCVPITTRSGLTVNLPAVETSWTPPLEQIPYNHDCVGDAPLPASPYLYPGLRLRHPPGLGGGFMIAPASPLRNARITAPPATQ